MSKIFTTACLLLSLSCAFAQPKAFIVLASDAPEPDVRAAKVLQNYLALMARDSVPIQSKASRKAPCIFIGASKTAAAFNFHAPAALPDDAFYMEGKSGNMLLCGGGEMGSEYAVYTLLEMLGCRKYSPRDSFMPPINVLRLPQFSGKMEAPAFPYRELWYEPATDDSWARWHKLKTRSRKNRDWGMFVHTFNQLCPPKTYFSTHPEYFAWNGAQRSDGQLCLSNDTVLQIVIEALGQKVKEKPEAKYWSVSQNDNYDYCKCARCAAADRRYGSPAGTLIAFVNKVAVAYPDKTISTLAYQYTRQAPTGIRPADNVSICLCSIECNRGQPIEEGCADFARDVRAWAALSHNLMIWDYVVQFRSYVSPFPNWPSLQPNVQFFKENGVSMLFEQGSGSNRSEFSDMRAYLLAKLMWNPAANQDSILNDFGEGYYGIFKPVVWGYIDQLTRAVAKHQHRLWIYDIPQNEAFLEEQAIQDTVDALFHRVGLSTRTSVPDNFLECAKHAEVALLPLEFARLERLKKDTAQLLAALHAPRNPLPDQLDQFVDRCLRNDFTALHEMGYDPRKYQEDYLEFLKKQEEAFMNKAENPVLAFPASPNYAHGDPHELCNRRIGETDYRYNWLGFNGNDLDVTIDVMGDSCSEIALSFLQDQSAWVFFPQEVRIEISQNGQQFKEVGRELIEIQSDGKKAVRQVEAHFPKQVVKKVRVRAVNQKTCPAWHTCNGNPCWIFADEVIVH